MDSLADKAAFQAQVLNKTIQPTASCLSALSLTSSQCSTYSAPDLHETVTFDTKEMRALLDMHNIEDRDSLFNLIIQSNLFNPRKVGRRVFVSPDYNQSMEQQREMTMKRLEYLVDCGAFKGWATERGPEVELKRMAVNDVISIYDHSLAVMMGAHYFLW